ncbi:hypothetical protein CDL12_02148 [Handroanthus impetiginosus]|uniref:Uncharacterized protein n=1 Tax=Handroanthus impetiginosus TaxID=429701 RepID=A0A2G9I652_9LAMI|nr:hypothetical protein CDL12_02148 [Handroanthus impetiginosus]
MIQIQYKRFKTFQWLKQTNPSKYIALTWFMCSSNSSSFHLSGSTISFNPKQKFDSFYNLIKPGKYCKKPSLSNTNKQLRCKTSSQFMNTRFPEDQKLNIRNTNHSNCKTNYNKNKSLKPRKQIARKITETHILPNFNRTTATNEPVESRRQTENNSVT